MFNVYYILRKNIKNYQNSHVENEIVFLLLMIYKNDY